jgi:hypothetical protein
MVCVVCLFEWVSWRCCIVLVMYFMILVGGGTV